jgi:potassium-transporting ATPase KdpC subunit
MSNPLLSQLRPAAVLLGLMTLALGLIYPLAMTGIAQLAFPDRARGSLLVVDGTVRGSLLIGQGFTEPVYFHGRPSAVGYDAAGSGGSNLAPSSAELVAAVAERAREVTARDGVDRVPIDLVTASGSGLDPHVSPAAARLQVGRIAAARGLDPVAVGALVDAHVEGADGSLLGAPRVNVLRLNLALDALAPEAAGR